MKTICLVYALFGIFLSTSFAHADCEVPAGKMKICSTAPLSVGAQYEVTCVEDSSSSTVSIELDNQICNTSANSYQYIGSSSPSLIAGHHYTNGVFTLTHGGDCDDEEE